MLLSDTETLILQLVALVVILAILTALAATPLYPVALGVVIIALLYVMMHGGSDVLKELVAFSGKQIG